MDAERSLPDSVLPRGARPLATDLPACPGQPAALMSGHSARLKSPQRSVVPNANPSIWVRSGRPQRGFSGADSAHRPRHISLASPLRATGGIRIVVGHCDRFLMEGGAHAQSAPTSKKKRRRFLGRWEPTLADRIRNGARATSMADGTTPSPPLFFLFLSRGHRAHASYRRQSANTWFVCRVPKFPP